MNFFYAVAKLHKARKDAKARNSETAFKEYLQNRKMLEDARMDEDYLANKDVRGLEREAKVSGLKADKKRSDITLEKADELANLDMEQKRFLIDKLRRENELDEKTAEMVINLTIKELQAKNKDVDTKLSLADIDAEVKKNALQIQKAMGEGQKNYLQKNPNAAAIPFMNEQVNYESNAADFSEKQQNRPLRDKENALKGKQIEAGLGADQDALMKSRMEREISENITATIENNKKAEALQSGEVSPLTSSERNNMIDQIQSRIKNISNSGQYGVPVKVTVADVERIVESVINMNATKLSTEQKQALKNQLVDYFSIGSTDDSKVISDMVTKFKEMDEGRWDGKK